MTILSLLSSKSDLPTPSVDYPATVSSTGTGAGSAGTTTATQVGAPTISGGSGSYSYSWARVSGSTAVQLDASNIQRPSFNAYASNGSPEEAVWRCTVTDNTYGTSATDNVTITCTWTQISNPTVSCDDESIQSWVFSPDIAYSGIQIHTNGNVYISDTNASGYTYSQQWLDSGASSNAKVDITYTGDTPTGTGTNLNLGTTRTVYLENSQITTLMATLTLTFKSESDGSTLDTATVYLTSIVDIM